MRMQVIKIVMILLVVGSSDTRPHKSDDLLKQAKTTENSEGWRNIRTLDVSHDIVRDDSRYTGTSGSNRKSYITYFRDSVDSSREHSANIYSPNKITHIFNARRSKLDDIWTSMPDFQATDISSEFSRTRVFEFSRIGAARNSSNNRPSLQDSSSESKTIHDDKVAWIRSILASNKSLGLGSGRINYSGKDIDNFEKLKFNVRSNQNFKSIVDQIPTSVRRNFVASNLPLSIDETTYYSPNTTKTPQKRQQKLGSIKYNLSNKDNILSNIPYSRINSSDTSLLKKANIPRRKDHRDAIYENTNRLDSVGTSYKNFQSDVVIYPFFHGTRCNILNNSRKSAHDIETRPSLIQIPKSGMVSRGKTVMSNRNFVKFRHPLSNSSSWRNVSNIVNSKLKINNNVSSVVVHLKNVTKSHLVQAVVKKSDATNNYALSELTKNHHSSFSQKLSSQTNERVSNKNKTRDKYNASPAGENAHLKNWPNDIPENIKDFYNYEKYISSLKEEPDQVAEQPVLLSNDSYFSYQDPILDSSVRKIIHWLQIPDIAPNTHFANDNQYYTNAYKPVESKLESIYGNFEPNQPSVSTEKNSYKIVIQKPLQNQKFDKTGYEDHPGRWPLPTSTAHHQYVTSSSRPFTLVPSSSFDATLLRNKTVYNPTTHVTQNTIVHILNNDLTEKKPNVTVTPQLESIVNQTVSSEYLTESFSDLAQRPNLHTMFTSQKNENHQSSKQKTNTFPSLSYNTNCPTIMINTYTRVNNTIQSKEGCTDLDIIVNSHVLNTNVIKPSDGPTEVVQQTSLATQSYADKNNKYSGQVDNLSHQDSVNSYVTASTGSYGSSPLETPGPNNYEYSYYDSQKNPVWISEQNNTLLQLSAIEMFQGTQISISGSNVPLSDMEADVTTESNLSVTEDPAGSFADHSSAPVDEALSSAAVSVSNVPASGTSVAGSPSSINFPTSVNMPLVALNSPGIMTGQANNGPTPGFLQLPVLPSFSVRPSAGSLLPSSASDDDDDDDDFDMSPADVLQSIASVFTSFTFMNPLDYSFFSLAAAPFAAMAAGVLGIVAVAFPWALPNVFDFGRTADKVTIRFRPSFEEFVKQAVHKYARLNEWKSRRRKHRR